MIRWYLLIWSAGEAAHDKECTVEQNTLVIAGGREGGGREYIRVSQSPPVMLSQCPKEPHCLKCVLFSSSANARNKPFPRGPVRRIVM